MELEQYIKIAKERLQSLEELVESKRFKEHYKKHHSEAIYLKQDSYVRGKIDELESTLADLEALESLTPDCFPPALIKRLNQK